MITATRRTKSDFFAPLAQVDPRGAAQSYSTNADPLRVVSGSVAFADTLAVVLASAAAHMLRNGSWSYPTATLWSTLVAAFLMLELMRGSGAYSKHFGAGLATQLRLALRNWSMVFALLLALAYLTKTSEAFSRIWAFTWFAGTLVGLATVRAVARFHIQRWHRCGRLARIVAVIDMGGDGQTLAREILGSGGQDTSLLGVFSARTERDRGIDELIQVTRRHRVDEIIVAAMGGDESEIGGVVRKLGIIPTNVHVCTSFLHKSFPTHEPTLLFGNPVLTIYRQPLTAWARVVKRSEDLALSVLLLLLLAPLMLGIAVAIKLDGSGPVLFRQKRQGLSNDIFEILKFRTMTYAPEPELEVQQARRNDPRVTSVGRILRRTSLDELPQLLNVLMGSMSLVGPRPHAVAHNDHYSQLIGGYLSRHRVQPGITGWAQVNGYRGETDTLEKMQCRVDYDLAYIEQWSLLFDLKILSMTGLRCIFGRNAY